jgi:ribosomal protein S18 acetylase RimI-like enzyme
MPNKNTPDAPGIAITKATRADATEVFALYRSIAGEKGVSVWTDDYPAPENVTEDIEGGSLYALKIGGAIVSVCSLGSYEDEGFDLSSFDKSVRRWAELSRVGTLAAFWRRGLSAMLVRYALEDARARGFDGVRLFVNELNPAAISHYAKLGVHYCGRTTAYGRNFLCGEFVFGQNAAAE